MMARTSFGSRDPSSFKFSFSYIEEHALSGWAIFGIILAVLISLAGIAVAVLYVLHKRKIIDVYIPYKLRVCCLKGYMTREESAAFKHNKKMLKRIRGNMDLINAIKKEPGKNGFRIEDSFFTASEDSIPVNESGEERKLEDDEAVV